MILPEIKNKQKEIVQLIPRFRYLSRIHIQSFLHHKDRQRINKWLQNLTEKQYLHRAYSNKIIGENRIPAIYSLDNNGIRYLKEQGMIHSAFLNKVYYDKNRSGTFIQHCLFLATICVQLAEKQSSSLVYKYATQHEWQNDSHTYHFLKETGITADLCITKKQKGRKKMYYLLEIFDERLPRYRIRKRIREYVAFFYNNVWENATSEAFPTLLFISFSIERMIYIKRYAKQIFQENDSPEGLIIHVANAKNLQRHGITGDIWEEIE